MCVFMHNSVVSIAILSSSSTCILVRILWEEINLTELQSSPILGIALLTVLLHARGFELYSSQGSYDICSIFVMARIQNLTWGEQKLNPFRRQIISLVWMEGASSHTIIEFQPSQLWHCNELIVWNQNSIRLIYGRGYQCSMSNHEDIINSKSRR